MGLVVGRDDDVERFPAHWLTVQESVDLGVRHTMGRFVRFARRQVFQIRRRNFLDQRLRRTKAARNRPHLILHQTTERCQITSAVAELGEETPEVPPP